MILLTMFSCTKLPATTDDGPVGLPDDGFITGMLNVNTIRSTIYEGLADYCTIGVYKANGSTHGAGSFAVNNEGSGYKIKLFNNVVERNNKGMYMTFKLNTELKDELLIPDDALFNLYVADSNGVIDTRVPSDKTLSYAQVTDGQLKISDLLGINIFSEEYGFSEKEINLILAYSGTDGNKYYIKYPFSFKYID